MFAVCWLDLVLDSRLPVLRHCSTVHLAALQVRFNVHPNVLLLDPFLNNGVTFASFHSAGTIPSLSDILKKIASGVLVSSVNVSMRGH